MSYSNCDIHRFEQFVSGNLAKQVGIKGLKPNLERDGEMIKKIGKEIANQKILMELEK